MEGRLRIAPMLLILNKLALRALRYTLKKAIVLRAKVVFVLALAVSLSGCIGLSPAEQTYNQAITYAKRGDYDSAIMLFKGVLREDPGSWEAKHSRYYLGLCYVMKGKLGKARKEWEIAARDKLRHPECLFRLGRLCEEFQDLQAAERYYRKASNLNGKAEEATIRLAIVLEKLGSTDEAIKLLREIAESARDPNFVGEAWARLGLIYYRLGKTQHAKECITAAGGRREAAGFLFQKGFGFLFLHKHLAVAEFKGVIELDPSWQDAYVNLASAYTNIGEPERAIGVTQQLAKINPRNASGHMNAAVAYINLGRIDKAREKYHEILDFGKDFEKCNACIQLGCIEAIVGDREKSKDWFSKAISFNPKDQEAATCLRMASTESGFSRLRALLIGPAREDEAAGLD